jgi:hypothetical protein
MLEANNRSIENWNEMTLSISKKMLRNIVSPACMMLFAATALAANITGTITDRTTGKPSAGDTIAVINTAQSMDEIVKVTSDAQGRFHATAPDGGQILLHVTHVGAEYFKSVPPGTTTVDIDVYDSATKIDGITGEALVFRVETDTAGKTLSIAENFFVQNASTPPRTQYGANTLDFYLPKGVVISQSLASSPGGLPTNTDVKPIDAASGHYAFTFPIRPGETRFQVTYTLPYSGKLPFSIKLSVPTGDVAVMLPKTMQFQAASQFQPINPDVNALSYDFHAPPFTQPIQFTLSGTGQLPQEQSQAGGDQSGSSGQPAQASSGARPGGGLGAPMDPEGTGDPWSKYKWWILGALGLALAAGAGVMLKNNPATATAEPMPFSEVPTADPISAVVHPTTPSPVAHSNPSSMLQMLKEELFELETDRLTGKLSDAQYAEHKAAFDLVLRRTLSRIDPGPPASNG